MSFRGLDLYHPRKCDHAPGSNEPRFHHIDRPATADKMKTADVVVQRRRTTHPGAIGFDWFSAGCWLRAVVDQPAT